MAAGAWGDQRAPDAGAGGSPGLHRCAGGRGPGSHAERHGPPGGRPRADQPLSPRGPGDRPLGPGGLLRDHRRLPRQCGEGVRAQRRAVYAAQVGAEVARQFPGGATRGWNRPPGESGVPRQGGHDPAKEWGDLRLSRHPGGDRLAHHHDQRSGGAGLGCGWHRGRGGDGGTALLYAGPQGGGLQAHGRATRGCHGHRPRPDRDPDPAPARGGGQVCGVLRPGSPQAFGGGPGHHCQHVSRIRSHHGLLPGGRGDVSLSSPHGAGPRAGRLGRAIHQGRGPLLDRRGASAPLLYDSGPRHVHRGAQPGRAEAPPGPGASEGGEEKLSRGPDETPQGTGLRTERGGAPEAGQREARERNV